MALSLKSSQLIGETGRLLEKNDFTEATPIEVVLATEQHGDDDEASLVDVGPSREMLIFEDIRSIIGLILYSTWPELDTNWELAQAAMAARISAHGRRADPKAWDGYLVLLTLDESAPVRPSPD